MKILHFSHTGTPDNRIERYAYLQKQEKHQVFLCGEKSSQQKQRFPKLKLFDGFYECPATLKVKSGIIPYFTRYKKSFMKIYNQLQPDVLHAHDIIAAKACCDLKLNFIYDDHEYWSKQVRGRVTKRFWHILTIPFLGLIYDKWEEEVLNNAATVVAVAETQAEAHRAYNSNVYTIPNFVTRYEMEMIPPLNQPENTLSAVTIIKDQTQYDDKFLKLLNQTLKSQHSTFEVIGWTPNQIQEVKYLGYLPHLDLFKYLVNSHVGLMSFPERRRKLGYFQYWTPNRVFQYAHCGVTPIIHEEMTFIKSCFETYAITINSKSEVAGVLKNLSQDKSWLQEQPRLIQEKARKEFLWDNLAGRIKQIYGHLSK